MRKVSFDVYLFTELDSKAKEKAIENARSIVSDVLNESDAEEYRCALKEIEKAFGILVYGWEVAPNCQPVFSFRFKDERWRQLEDMERPEILLRFFNEVDDNVRAKDGGKYYSTAGCYDENHQYHYKKRHSKVLFDMHGYCLTGTWTTEAIDDALNWFYQDAYQRRDTIREFVQNTLESFFSKWRDDMENNLSDECIEEHLKVNEYEFYNDGRIYK